MVPSGARLLHSIVSKCSKADLNSPGRPRPVVGVTQFPAGVTVAATWDHDLIYARSHAMGQEFKGKGPFSGVLATDPKLLEVDPSLAYRCQPRSDAGYRRPARSQSVERPQLGGA